MGKPENEPLKRIACLTLAESEALALLRLEPTLEIAVAEKHLWVRGDFAHCETKLTHLRVVEIFEELPDDLLGISGSKVPVRKLPSDLAWRPISEATRLRLGQSAYPGTAEDGIPLRLIRSEIVRPIRMLSLKLAAFSQWVGSSPSIRFRDLTFACSIDGQVLVRGNPVPPLPGRRYVLEDGLAMPAGFALDPPLPVSVVRRLFDTNRAAVIRFEEDAEVEVIEDSVFVPVTRAGVRMTLKQKVADAA